MIFLKDDEFNTTHPTAHLGDDYSTKVLSRSSKELGYLRSNALVAEFKGLNTLIEFLNEYAPKPLRLGQSDKNESGRGFHFFKNYKEAQDTYLLNPSSVRKFDEKDEVLNGGEESGKTVEYDLTGDYIDIDRFIEGVPEVFGYMTDGNPRARRVTIAVNLSWTWMVNETVINARCARIARLVDWLESQQIRTSVVGIESTECGHWEITIKQFDEPLNLNDIAVLSHSDFLRRILFRMKEYSATWESGYGSSVAFSEAISKSAFHTEFNNEYSVFVDSRARDIQTVNKDFDDVEKLLADVLIDDNADESKRSVAILR